MGLANLFRARAGASYQDKRSSEDNWQMIKAEIAGASNVVDVACDAGYYALKVAETGASVFAFDILEDSINRARQKATSQKLDNAMFSVFALTPDNIGKMPRYDFGLCLSVFHHFVRQYGETAAKQMLVDLFDRTHRGLFLQIPSKIGKYTPAFSVNFDGSETKTREYLADLFGELPDAKIRYIGKKVEKPPTEDYRFLYLVEHV